MTRAEDCSPASSNSRTRKRVVFGRCRFADWKKTISKFRNGNFLKLWRLVGENSRCFRHTSKMYENAPKFNYRVRILQTGANLRWYHRAFPKTVLSRHQYVHICSCVANGIPRAKITTQCKHAWIRAARIHGKAHASQRKKIPQLLWHRK